jgi:hypothetical protein
LNLADAPLEPRDAPPGFEYRSASVREALGGDLIGCTLYELDEGKQLWPYHFHWNNEEWLVVVAGAPTLRTPDGERGAHTVFGPGRFAIFSTRRQGSVVYPDSGKVGAGPPWDRLYFRRSDAVDYWLGET